VYLAITARMSFAGFVSSQITIAVTGAKAAAAIKT
tara:strand:- start:475 stop:579 length:105 start_codon:yes stop_codon:yes gene_type:complete